MFAFLVGTGDASVGGGGIKMDDNANNSALSFAMVGGNASNKFGTPLCRLVALKDVILEAFFFFLISRPYPTSQSIGFANITLLLIQRLSLMF